MVPWCSFDDLARLVEESECRPRKNNHPVATDGFFQGTPLSNFETNVSFSRSGFEGDSYFSMPITASAPSLSWPWLESLEEVDSHGSLSPSSKVMTTLSSLSPSGFVHPSAVVSITIVHSLPGVFRPVMFRYVVDLGQIQER